MLRIASQTRCLAGVLSVPARAASSLSESFLSGTSATYIDVLHEKWEADPASVHASWAEYFEAEAGGAAPGEAYTPRPQQSAKAAAMAAAAGGGSGGVGSTDLQMRIMHLIRAYQVRGHEAAKLDPLGLKQPELPPELLPETYGFTAEELAAPIGLTSEKVDGFMSSTFKDLPLKDLLAKLERTYAGSVGVEFMHVRSREECNWLRQQIEVAEAPRLAADDRRRLHERLAFAHGFERFLARKWNTAKRFGLEGAEALVPGMKFMIDRLSQTGTENVVIGMPHRGRLNVLGNVIRKPLDVIFREFAGTHIDMEAHTDFDNPDYSGSGDVKYHLGTSFDRTYDDGRRIHLALMANPSHLEAVNPVVAGKVRAKQYFAGEPAGIGSVAVLLHGDAAFAGQGVVYESMQLGQLDSYGTGGTIHVVVNNQVGFTTDPRHSRSTLYCSDIGRAFDVPIFHVNGDDAEAVVRVMQLAADWRQKWRRDVIVDMVCYRQHGHNEVDEPMFTQPAMYQTIGSHPPTLDLYESKLLADGTLTDEAAAAVREEVDDTFEASYRKSEEPAVIEEEWLDSAWAGWRKDPQKARIKTTAVSEDVLSTVGSALYSLPEGFTLHRTLKRVIKAREKSLKEGAGIDWGTAEALAFGSLLLEGNHVRLSGQDVQRGTFSHRHAVLHDQKTSERYEPLNHLGGEQAKMVTTNSHLSEFAVLGFELGYSQEDPNQLVLWEAQFGDFVNGAQVIIDQFLSAGESKWNRMTGLTMLLPHGYDGMGPEHSSCRVERFLQMSDDDEEVVPDRELQMAHSNWAILNCTTPAQYFHALRRQVHRDFRKPLIVVAPKNLLRHPQAKSSLADFTDGSAFHYVLPEAEDEGLVADDAIRRVILCTGKVYYDLLAERTQRGIDDIALLRVEQLAPFPYHDIAEQMQRYTSAEMLWAQEEPKNMGAWAFVQPRIVTSMRDLLGKDVHVHYAGRAASSSPASGFASVHAEEQKHLIDIALAE